MKRDDLLGWAYVLIGVVTFGFSYNNDFYFDRRIPPHIRASTAFVASAVWPAYWAGKASIRAWKMTEHE